MPERKAPETPKLHTYFLMERPVNSTLL